MTEERVTPLRQQMIEDMPIRGMGDKAKMAHIRAIKDFGAFLVQPRGGSDCLNRFRAFLKWISASVTPLPRLAVAD